MIRFQKDKKFRNSFNFFEKKQRIGNFLLRWSTLTLVLRKRLAKQQFLRYSRKQYAFIRGRNRCILTDRGRAIYRKFRLSRQEFKRKASQGFLVGVKKRSW